MFFDEKTERDISKMIKPENMMSDQQRMPSSQYARKIGGPTVYQHLNPLNYYIRRP